LPLRVAPCHGTARRRHASSPSSHTKSKVQITKQAPTRCSQQASHRRSPQLSLLAPITLHPSAPEIEKDNHGATPSKTLHTSGERKKEKQTMKLLHLPYAATSHRMRSCRIPSSPCGNHDRQPPAAVDEQQQTKTTPPPDSHHYMYTQPAAAKGGAPVPLTLLVVRPCEVVSMHRSPRLAQAFQLSPFCISNHCDHPGVTPLNRLHTSYSYADKSVDCACCYAMAAAGE
jgi:hypothetical protein